jgi:poly(hydroxyalkanoate) granule-associated protein
MATRQSRRGKFASDGDTAQALADSAQKIWLAGLGAFARARAEGPKMFEVLVEQGKGLADRARDSVDHALQSARDGAGDAGGRFGKLEQAFEDRLSKSLGRLGVMTRGEVADLSRQVADLTEEVRSLVRASAGIKAKRSVAAKPRGAKRAVSSKRGAKRGAARKS